MEKKGKERGKNPPSPRLNTGGEGGYDRRLARNGKREFRWERMTQALRTTFLK